VVQRLGRRGPLGRVPAHQLVHQVDGLVRVRVRVRVRARVGVRVRVSRDNTLALTLTLTSGEAEGMSCASGVATNCGNLKFMFCASASPCFHELALGVPSTWSGLGLGLGVRVRG